MPSTTNFFLSIDEYDQIFDLRHINCLATSFIRTYNLQHQLEIRLASCALDTSKEIGEAYLTKVDDLQQYLGYDRKNLKRISLESVEQSTAHEFRLIYGFQKKTVTRSMFGFEYEEEMDDFHVIIGVRDSTGNVRWYHKFGVSNELPREVTPEDWDEIHKTYTTNPVPALFEFSEPER